MFFFTFFILTWLSATIFVVNLICVKRVDWRFASALPATLFIFLYCASALFGE